MFPGGVGELEGDGPLRLMHLVVYQVLFGVNVVLGRVMDVVGLGMLVNVVQMHHKFALLKVVGSILVLAVQRSYRVHLHLQLQAVISFQEVPPALLPFLLVQSIYVLRERLGE